ncbi:Octanoyl-(GcvH):protein N-octanoyltransferase [Carnobacterium maltaromaticum]|uniref:lipoate--protein ligase family protein n=1 Tax=Carnobacterium maltaromaticum TaxID=2751 RepID=UPI00191B9D07|nr:lipoate--protein ligase family protein [Carnobacterium maltaromaticum]CAD5902668.1 Octanoyl-(GcvH):protein N-octanoyltransferase [Carnobacterium maltaromaticum]
MSEVKQIDYLKEQSYTLYDSDTMPFSNRFLSHFALGDSLIKRVGEAQKEPVLHFWTADELVILGMMDTKLPHFSTGLDSLARYNKNYIVRNAGGLAVVADAGVLNLSMIFPDNPTHKISIDEGYHYMFRLIHNTFKAYGKSIEAYEITESYCPGDFDLSIDGKKFAGIAQRRLRNGIGVMIYLSVNGNQEKRAEMLYDFYHEGLQGEVTKWKFPHVNPAVMATLEELLDTSFSVSDVKKMILKTLSDNNNTLIKGQYDPDLVADYQVAFGKMVQRNEQMLQENLNKELLL